MLEEGHSRSNEGHAACAAECRIVAGLLLTTEVMVARLRRTKSMVMAAWPPAEWAECGMDM